MLAATFATTRNLTRFENPPFFMHRKFFIQCLSQVEVGDRRQRLAALPVRSLPVAGGAGAAVGARRHGGRADGVGGEGAGGEGPRIGQVRSSMPFCLLTTSYVEVSLSYIQAYEKSVFSH